MPGERPPPGRGRDPWYVRYTLVALSVLIVGGLIGLPAVKDRYATACAALGVH